MKWYDGKYGVMGSRLNENNNWIASDEWRVTSDECRKTNGKASAVLSIKKTTDAVRRSEVRWKRIRSAEAV